MSENELYEVRQQIRKAAIERRDGIEEHLRSAFSHLIKKRVEELIEALAINTVHCYLNVRSEVETAGLITSLQSTGIEIISPVVDSSGADRALKHYYHTEEKTIGRYNLSEPLREREAVLEIIEAVIIPMVAYDGTGMRLGYGKGFYDQFLSQLNPSVARIGLAYSIQEVDSIPRLPHDELMHYIVTENALVNM